MSLDQKIDLLPHRTPFRFVSRLREMDSGRCVGVWDVSGEEWFLEGHFPGKPIVPGVLLTEALAQLGGLAVNTILEEGSAPVIGMLVASDIRFRTPVIPPASIDLETQITHSVGLVHQLKAEAKVDGTCCAEGTLSLHVGERA